MKSTQQVKHGMYLIAFAGLVALGVLVAGCGVLRREVARETPRPPSTTAVPPTDTAVAPTATSTESRQAATPTHAAAATSRPSGLATPPPGTGGIAIGVYQPQQDTSGKAIDRYISQVGKKPAFAWQPMPWQRFDGSFRLFDPGVLDEYRTRGIMPGLTWEPSKGPEQRAGKNQPEFSWKELASGRYDAYITQFAKDAAAYHYPFVLRILHEMDGSWYPWGYGVNGNTNPAAYVAAYRHIVNLFRAAGATNVQFVWNPSVVNAGAVQQYGQLFKQGYPGDNYVDWVALDGYNLKLDNWQSLQDVFQPTYRLVTSFSKRPMMLFEVGSVANPQDPMARANWITQGFLVTIPQQFPAVKVVVWFNSQDGAGRNFSLDTPQALSAWKQVVLSPLYQGSLLK